MEQTKTTLSISAFSILNNVNSFWSNKTFNIPEEAHKYVSKFYGEEMVKNIKYTVVPVEISTILDES